MYANVEDARNYSRVLYAANRKAWIDSEGGCCALCGEDDYTVLEVDHIDASTKLFNPGAHGWGSLNSAAMQAELAKCRVLCHNCHVEKTTKALEHPRGSSHANTKLSNEAVLEIRELAGKHTKRAIAKMFGVSDVQVGNIIRRKQRTDV